MKVLSKQRNSRMCVICGLDNPAGVRAPFYNMEDHSVMSKFKFSVNHQSYPGRVHGGMITAMLDEMACLTRDLLVLKTAGNAGIHNGSHHQGYEQLKGGLQQLKQRAENALFPKSPHISHQFSHFSHLMGIIPTDYTILLQFMQRNFPSL